MSTPFKIGDKMEDGSFYAGISPENKKATYITPTDAPEAMTFKEAKSYADKLEVCGHNDWRVPARSEIYVLFNNLSKAGTFDENSGGNKYWSSLTHNFSEAWGLDLSSGKSSIYRKKDHLFLRCVRYGNGQEKPSTSTATPNKFNL